MRKGKSTFTLFLLGLIALSLLIFASACTDAEKASWSSYGEAFVITLHSADGKVIERWESTGKVNCTDGGICFFMDAATRKLVGTTGDIIVRVK